MGLKFYFNQKAWEALAKELRRVSWYVGVLLSACGYNLKNAWVLLFGAAFWSALQLIALLLESIKNERK